jgi:hypothetical protein
VGLMDREKASSEPAPGTLYNNLVEMEIDPARGGRYAPSIRIPPFPIPGDEASST